MWLQSSWEFIQNKSFLIKICDYVYGKFLHYMFLYFIQIHVFGTVH